MLYLKKTLKIISNTFLFLLTFLVVYVLMTFVLSYISIEKEKTSDVETIEIYIKTNGVHTDLVVPISNEIKDWSQQILFTNTISQDSSFQYVALGWGDRAFYLETPTWADLKFSTAIKAATGMSKTAMHTTFYHTIKENERCIKIKITTNQYQKLINYIENSFSKDMNSNFINIKTNANYDTNDAFYEAIGSYSLFKTCNTWANNALKITQQKHALWTPTDHGIFIHYRK